mmetsp:Transcript_15533/g.41670  ORF Transcript_15533/g.41670 Transcript_15533/m.41670 type:complete len:209 (+) Transcript_15533:95-721(+)
MLYSIVRLRRGHLVCVCAADAILAARAAARRSTRSARADPEARTVIIRSLSMTMNRVCNDPLSVERGLRGTVRRGAPCGRAPWRPRVEYCSDVRKHACRIPSSTLPGSRRQPTRAVDFAPRPGALDLRWVLRARPCQDSRRVPALDPGGLAPGARPCPGGTPVAALSACIGGLRGECAWCVCVCVCCAWGGHVPPTSSLRAHRERRQG